MGRWEDDAGERQANSVGRMKPERHLIRRYCTTCTFYKGWPLLNAVDTEMFASR